MGTGKCIFKLLNWIALKFSPLNLFIRPASRGCGYVHLEPTHLFCSKTKRGEIPASDLRPLRLAIYPPGVPFLLFPCPLTSGCVGWEGCFLPDFSFASELGTGIITCLYDQLPDYSPETRKMSEERSPGLCCSGGRGCCTACTHRRTNTSICTQREKHVC